jgi:hypothetical protein
VARIREDFRFSLFGLARSRRDSRYDDLEEDSVQTARGIKCPVMMQCPVQSEDTENIQQYHDVPESAPCEEVQTKPATSDVLMTQRTHFEKWVDGMKERVEWLEIVLEGCVQMDYRGAELNPRHDEILEELWDLLDLGPGAELRKVLWIADAEPAVPAAACDDEAQRRLTHDIHKELEQLGGVQMLLNILEQGILARRKQTPRLQLIVRLLGEVADRLGR